MIIRCIALDDEPRALEVLENHAGRTDFIKLEKTFTDPFQAIAYINQSSIDLVFLDINMPDIDGLSVLSHLRSKPLVIFTTAHSEYALESYEVDALDYLLKPFDYARFFKAVSKARDRLEELKPAKELLFVNTGNKQERINLRQLQYIESEGNYVNYVTASEKLLVRASIKDTLKSLPETQFLQIHRSYIVALAHIDRIEDNHVFINKKMIPVGATYRAAFNRMIDGLKR